jgi:hypothetical protein
MHKALKCIDMALPKPLKYIDMKLPEQLKHTDMKLEAAGTLLNLLNKGYRSNRNTLKRRCQSSCNTPS